MMDKLQHIKESIMQHFDFSSFKTWGIYTLTVILGFSVKQLTEIGGLVAIWLTVIAGFLGLYLTWLKIVKQKKINEEDQDSE